MRATSHILGLASRRSRLALAAALCGLSLSACSTVRVTTQSDRVTRGSIQSANLLRKAVNAPLSVLAEFADASADLLKNARILEARGDRNDAAGAFLKAAVDAHDLLVSQSEVAGSDAELALLEIHNKSLARFAEIWAEDPRRAESGPYRMTGGGDILEIDLSAGSHYQKGYFDRFVSAESVRKRGIVPVSRQGVGATLVGIREQRPERAEEMRFYAQRGLMVPVTLTVDSVTAANGVRRVMLSLRNPFTELSMPLGGRTVPLAADLSSHVAMVLDGQSEARRALDGFFKADQRVDSSGLFLTEPYDPKRIPVILTHGLVSVPIIWRNVIPEVMSDPEISRRYQFMVFTYPTSFPVIQTARLYRENLAAARAALDPDGNDPLSRNVVAIGHSMGGILSHALVSDIDDRLWKQFSDTPFDQVPMDPAKREELRQLVFFEPDPGVRRAVFIATPHRGSVSADRGLSQFIARTARIPLEVLESTAKLIDPSIAPNLKLKIDPNRKVTAVESLRPGAPVISALDASPFKKGVVYHSIIGDRGRGDSPESSDGTVEYWSSHQAGAASELIVPTGHGAYKHPRAIEEVRRILREHAGIR
jgi:pimeloyl-ACP methyl ester carboxylesterase